MQTSTIKKLYLRRGGLLLGLLMLFLFACSEGQERLPAAPPAEPASQAKKVYAGTIIAVGDSLTAGLGVTEEEAYPAVLQKKLRQAGFDWQVINGGISGETSSGALSRMAWIIARQPDIVILETGANDGMRGIPARVIRDNISRAVDLLEEADVTVVLAGMQMLQNLGPAYTEEFAAVYPAVAEKHGVILIPFFLEKVAGNPSLNLEDGIHPNPAGQRIVAQTVYPYVVKAIESGRAH